MGCPLASAPRGMGLTCSIAMSLGNVTRLALWECLRLLSLYLVFCSAGVRNHSGGGPGGGFGFSFGLALSASTVDCRPSTSHVNALITMPTPDRIAQPLPTSKDERF